MSPAGDPDVRERFASLRTDDRRLDPGFDAVVARRSRRASARMAPAWSVAALVIVAFALATAIELRRAVAPPSTAPDATALLGWRAPTDFLLETPGQSLLSAVPRFGSVSELGIPSEGESPASPSRS